MVDQSSYLDPAKASKSTNRILEQSSLGKSSIRVESKQQETQAVLDVMSALQISFQEKSEASNSQTANKSFVFGRIKSEVEKLKLERLTLRKENQKLKEDIDKIATMVWLQTKASVRVSN